MAAATSTSDVSATSIINKHIQALREIHDRLKNEQQEVLQYSKPKIADCIDELEKLSEKLRLPIEKVAADNIVIGSFQVPLDGSTMLAPKLVQIEQPIQQFKEESSSMNENGTNTRKRVGEPLAKERYLCISDGFVICCLDLEQSKDTQTSSCLKPQPLPKMSTLKLLEEGLPISMGLFKLGSDAYMIGGQQFSEFKMDNDLWGLKLVDFLYQKYGLQGTSRDAYRLCLADGSLSLSKCKSLGQMNKPKFWPIVEKIDDQVHVIEYLPWHLSFYRPDTISSHEVLNLNDLARGWIELSPTHTTDDEELDLYIRSHLVAGDRIYANARSPQFDGRYMFDSKAKKWKLHPRQDQYSRTSDMYNVKHVGSLFESALRLGARRCMQGKSRNPNYVVFAMQDNDVNECAADIMAYLVTSTGKILCYQRVNHILEGFERRFSVSQGTLIDVDEQGKTMCIILHGITNDLHKEEFLFISTFTMERIPDTHSPLMQDSQYGPLDEREFVHIVVKQRYVYNTDACLGEKGDIANILHFGACFL